MSIFVFTSPTTDDVIFYCLVVALIGFFAWFEYRVQAEKKRRRTRVKPLGKRLLKTNEYKTYSQALRELIQARVGEELYAKIRSGELPAVPTVNEIRLLVRGIINEETRGLTEDEANQLTEDVVAAVPVLQPQLAMLRDLATREDSTKAVVRVENLQRIVLNDILQTIGGWNLKPAELLQKKPQVRRQIEFIVTQMPIDLAEDESKKLIEAVYARIFAFSGPTGTNERASGGLAHTV